MITREFLTPKMLADLFAVSIRTVEDWRRMGKGPRWFKAGKHVRYAMKDVSAWQEAQYVH